MSRAMLNTISFFILVLILFGLVSLGVYLLPSFERSAKL